MDAVISTVSAPQAAPQPQQDLRPTADTAALVRDPQPSVPMAIPASMGQSAAVNASRMADTTTRVEETMPTERVLKPFGVAMLPESHEQRAEREASEAADEPAEDAPAES